MMLAGAGGDIKRLFVFFLRAFMFVCDVPKVELFCSLEENR
jgi:hypothetical protein